MRISLFGNLRISSDDRQVTTVNTNRLQSLLAYLVLHGDAPVPRERLAYLLWPASGEFQAAKAKAGAARAATDLEREMTYLKAADSLYEDDLLPALYDDWLSPLREALRNQLSEVLSRLASILEE